jgi:hypothetical protein
MKEDLLSFFDLQDALSSISVHEPDQRTVWTGEYEFQNSNATCASGCCCLTGSILLVDKGERISVQASADPNDPNCATLDGSYITGGPPAYEGGVRIEFTSFSAEQPHFDLFGHAVSIAQGNESSSSSIVLTFHDDQGNTCRRHAHRRTHYQLLDLCYQVNIGNSPLGCFMFSPLAMWGAVQTVQPPPGVFFRDFLEEDTEATVQQKVRMWDKWADANDKPDPLLSNPWTSHGLVIGTGGGSGSSFTTASGVSDKHEMADHGNKDARTGLGGSDGGKRVPFQAWYFLDNSEARQQLHGIQRLSRILSGWEDGFGQLLCPDAQSPSSSASSSAVIVPAEAVEKVLNASTRLRIMCNANKDYGVRIGESIVHDLPWVGAAIAATLLLLAVVVVPAFPAHPACRWSWWQMQLHIQCSGAVLIVLCFAAAFGLYTALIALVPSPSASVADALGSDLIEPPPEGMPPLADRPSVIPNTAFAFYAVLMPLAAGCVEVLLLSRAFVHVAGDALSTHAAVGANGATGKPPHSKSLVSTLSPSGRRYRCGVECASLHCVEVYARASVVLYATAICAFLAIMHNTYGSIGWTLAFTAVLVTAVVMRHKRQLQHYTLMNKGQGVGKVSVHVHAMAVHDDDNTGLLLSGEQGVLVLHLRSDIQQAVLGVRVSVGVAVGLLALAAGCIGTGVHFHEALDGHSAYLGGVASIVGFFWALRCARTLHALRSELSQLEEELEGGQEGGQEEGAASAAAEEAAVAEVAEMEEAVCSALVEQTMSLTMPYCLAADAGALAVLAVSGLCSSLPAVHSFCLYAFVGLGLQSLSIMCIFPAVLQLVALAGGVGNAILHSSAEAKEQEGLFSPRAHLASADSSAGGGRDSNSGGLSIDRTSESGLESRASKQLAASSGSSIQQVEGGTSGAVKRITTFPQRPTVVIPPSRVAIGSTPTNAGAVTSAGEDKQGLLWSKQHMDDAAGGPASVSSPSSLAYLLVPLLLFVAVHAPLLGLSVHAISNGGLDLRFGREDILPVGTPLHDFFVALEDRFPSQLPLKVVAEGVDWTSDKSFEGMLQMHQRLANSTWSGRGAVQSAASATGLSASPTLAPTAIRGERGSRGSGSDSRGGYQTSSERLVIVDADTGVGDWLLQPDGPSPTDHLRPGRPPLPAQTPFATYLLSDSTALNGYCKQFAEFAPSDWVPAGCNRSLHEFYDAACPPLDYTSGIPPWFPGVSYLKLWMLDYGSNFLGQSFAKDLAFSNRTAGATMPLPCLNTNPISACPDDWQRVGLLEGAQFDLFTVDIDPRNIEAQIEIMQQVQQAVDGTQLPSAPSMAAAAVATVPTCTRNSSSASSTSSSSGSGSNGGGGGGGGGSSRVYVHSLLFTILEQFVLLRHQVNHVNLPVGGAMLAVLSTGLGFSSAGRLRAPAADGHPLWSLALALLLWVLPLVSIVELLGLLAGAFSAPICISSTTADMVLFLPVLSAYVIAACACCVQRLSSPPSRQSTSNASPAANSAPELSQSQGGSNSSSRPPVMAFVASLSAVLLLGALPLLAVTSPADVQISYMYALCLGLALQHGVFSSGACPFLQLFRR